MRHDVTAVWRPLQEDMFANQGAVEDKALKLLIKNPKKAREYLTDYSRQRGEEVAARAWKLGDELWTKYDEQF
jgi:dipeptidase